MALKLYGETDVQNIADEIRFYNEKEDKYRVEDMTLGVQNIAENIEDNLGTTRTVEGTYSLSYVDAKDYRIQEATYQGDVEQDSTTGRNLLPRFIEETQNGITLKVNADGSVVLNGTSTNTVIFMVELGTLPAGKYYLSGCTGSTGGYKLDVQEIIAAGTLPLVCYTTEVSADLMSSKYRARIVVYNGNTLNNIVMKPMLSTTGGDYEPYTGGTAAPNPEYPQDVRTVRGYNLYEGSQDWSGTWGNSNAWSTDENNYNNMMVKKTNKQWNGLYKQLQVEKDKTYTFSLYAKSDSPRDVTIYLAGGTATFTPTVKAFKTTSSWQRYSLTFTATSSGTIRPRLENVSSDTSIYTYICGYQLNEGNEKAYIPYNSIGIKRTKKNLCKFDKVNNRVISETIPKGTYTFSLDVYGGVGYGLFANSAEGTRFTTRYPSSGRDKVTFTLNEPANIYINAWSSVAGKTFEELTDNWQLEQSSVATDYEPYAERIDYIDLQGNELLSTDELKIDRDGNVKLIKNWGKVVLDGSESWGKISMPYVDGYYLTLPDGMENPASNNLTGAKFTHFIERTPAYNWNTPAGETNFCFNTGSAGQLRLSKGEAKGTGDLATFKTWLGQNKPSVYYKLAKTQEINLGKIKVKSLEGLNNVSILAEAEPTVMSETYMLDSQSKYLPKVTTEDTKIDYVAQFPLDVKMDGNTHQETTTGKNLVDGNDFIGKTIGGNQTLPETNVIGGNEYTITISQTITAFGSQGNDNDKKAQHWVRWLDDSGNTVAQSAFCVLTFTSLNETKTVSQKVTAPTGATKVRFDIGAYFANSCKLTQNFIQFEKGSATDYEPYTNGASPNPEYPQNIETVKSWNLLNIYDNQLQSLNGMSKVGDKYFLNGITFELKEKGIIEVNGTATANSDCYLAGAWSSTSSTFMKLKKGTYVLSNKGNAGYVYINNKTSVVASTNVAAIFNTDNIDLTSMFVRITAGTTVKNGTIIPQLTIGNDRPYLPYNLIAVKKTGRNLYNIKEALSYGGSGFVLSQYTQEMIKGSGTASWGNAFQIFKVEKNTNYSLSATFKEEVIEHSIGITVYGSLDGTITLPITIKSTPATIKANEEKRVDVQFNTGDYGYIVVRYWNNSTNDSLSTTTKLSIYDIMLEDSSVIAPYEPYKEEITYIDLQGNELCKIGDVKDELKIDDKGNAKLIKRIGKIVLDGSESWANDGSAFFYTSKFGGILSQPFAISQYAVYSAKGSQADALARFYITRSGANYLEFSKYNFEDVSSFKTWLSQNKPIVYYILATPQEIDLGKQDKLIPLEGTNNIETLAELEPSKMETTYYIDAKKYIEDMTSALLEYGGEN